MNSIPTLINIPVNAQFINLSVVLKKFFELPGLYDETIEYMEMLRLNSEIITNFVQGTFWKERMSTFEDKTVVPVIMYFDDYANNNPLGSHKGLSKSGAVYINIPALPARYQAKIENIFVFLLFNTIDRKVFTNSMIFTKAAEALNFLNERGIEIELPSGRKKIYFELALFVGDNLGLHTILGFNESFKANSFCHHCLCTQSEKNTIFIEKDCNLRTREYYETSLALNNPTLSRIKERCVLHKINNFHLTQNVAVDVMHDILEGICRHSIALILNHLILNWSCLL